MKRRTRIRAAAFALAAVTALLAWGISGSVQTKRCKMQLGAAQQRALLQTCEYLDSMETTLQKASYAGSGAMLQSLSTQLHSQALGAKTGLAALSSGNAALYNMFKYLSQVGEYAAALNKSLTAGEPLGAKDRRTLRQLYGYAQKLSAQFSYMADLMDAGSFSFEVLDDALRQTDAAADTVSFPDAAADAEESMADFPTLIYDGPYSDTLLERSSQLLKEAEEISYAAAKKTAAKALGAQERLLMADGETAGRLPSYVFHAEDRRIAVTKRGGYIAYILSDYTAGEAKLSQKEAVAAAADYLQKTGYTNMVSTYSMNENGVCIVNFAYRTEGYLCYPDLIKVGVSLSDGRAVSLDARDFLLNHIRRTPPEATVTQTAAAAVLADTLTVQNVSLAVIPTPGGYERYCYEFLCADEDGQDVLVYVDTRTGQEDDILILLYADGGTLTK